MNNRGNTTRYFFIFSRSDAFLGFKRAFISSSHFIGNRFHQVRLTHVKMSDMLDLHFGTVSESHFIAGVSEDKECYEDKSSQHNRHNGEPLFVGQFVAFPFYESGKTSFGREPHLIIYGSLDT